RPRALHRLRLRRRLRPPHDGAVLDPRHPHAVRRRRAVPGAVRGGAMRIPLSWLREHCPSDADVDWVADRLSRHGVQVEGLLRPWEGLSGVIVARVTDKRPHPNSDHLTLARLETGDGEARVAAGVANWEVGDLVAYARPGSRVPVLPEPLSVRRMGGEE